MERQDNHLGMAGSDRVGHYFCRLVLELRCVGLVKGIGEAETEFQLWYEFEEREI